MSTLIKNAILPELFATKEIPAGTVNVLIDGEAIASITPTNTTAPDADTSIDATGLYLTPGLIDTHVHLLEQGDLKKLANWGVTTVAELGTHPDSLIKELKALPNLPTIISAGTAATAQGSPQTEHMGFPKDSVVSGPDDAERFIQWRIDNDADLIKIIVEDPNNPRNPGLDEATLTALVTSAHRHGLLTIAHAATVGSYNLALKAGVDILTHAPLEATLPADLIEQIKTQEKIVSPTIVMMQGFARALSSKKGPALDLSNTLDSVRALHQAGVPIIAGTDANTTPGSPSPVAHGESLHEELELLTRAGLTPAEAIYAATTAAAKALRLNDRGTLETGKRADLTLFTADPTADVANSRDIAQVWIGGEQVR